MTPAGLLRLAWRESRFARRRLFLFLSAISLGVAALVAVQGFAADMSAGVRAEARALLGADLVVSSNEPFGDRTTALVDSLRGAGAGVARRTSFPSMALLPRTDATRLVQVRAPEPGYPFYGRVETRPSGAWSRLHGGRNAIVDPALLTALGAVVGDSLALGERRYEIVAVLERVPGDTEIESAFAPRVFIPAAGLEATGLLGFGSRIEREAFVRLPDPASAERVERKYGRALRAERAGIESAAEQQEDLERAFGRLSSFLGLVAALALLLGGIGVASAMGAYMARKADSVAILRCLGATARQVFAIYLVQAVAMGLAGAAVGAALGVAVQRLLPGLLSDFLPVQVHSTFAPAAVVAGLGVGVWTAVIFALLPLVPVRRVSPLGALRRRVEAAAAPAADRLRWVLIGVLAASAFGLIALQVDDVELAAGIVAATAAALGLLRLGAALMIRALRGVRGGRLPFALRHGLASVHRPGNQTGAVVLALGAGVFLLASLLVVQRSLLRPLTSERAVERANLVLWDVQPEQEAGAREILRESGLRVEQSVPIVSMRIAEIRRAAGEARPGRTARWALRREYRSTYRDTASGTERVVAGEFWDARGAAPQQVSLETGIAEELGVAVGDTIVWNVQGIRLTTRVTSLREVEWARLEPNFFAVFPTAALRRAPAMRVLLARGDSAKERAAALSAIVRSYPNVSGVDVTRVQETLDEVAGRITAVIRFLAAFSMATGFVVLLGAVATGRGERIRESVLLKTIGATRAQVRTMLLVEYVVLGALAAAVGIALAMIAGWLLVRNVFEVEFAPALLPLLGLGLAVAALSGVVGLRGGREVFAGRIVPALREE